MKRYADVIIVLSSIIRDTKDDGLRLRLKLFKKDLNYFMKLEREKKVPK